MSVSTIPVLKQDTAVYVTGYGQVTPVNMVDICPEVSGRIVEKNENLDQGRQVQKGQLLFKMDTTISFWAGMGIPISLLGGLAIVYFAGITLNKITLFGLIMVLGIVADDAIVVGESIFYYRKKGASTMDAVINGVSEVAMPVLAAVLTTIVAFFPLYHIDGMMGKFIVALPTAVIACLVVSLVECMVMLPAHLSNLKDMNLPPGKKNWFFTAIG